MLLNECGLIIGNKSKFKNAVEIKYSEYLFAKVEDISIKPKVINKFQYWCEQ
jgi:hypothetical protein